MALDRLLGGGRLPSDARPVYLVGHLRSGTTFLHRFLARVPGLRAPEMWELLFPGRPLRWLLRPVRGLLGRIDLSAVYDPAIHRTGLREAETDDIAAMFRFGRGLLAWIYGAWDPVPPAAVASQIREACAAPQLQRHLEAVHAALPGRVLSKSFTGLYLLRSQLDAHPGARALLLVRDPAEVVPSTLSMQRSVQGALHGLDPASDTARVYFENLRRGSGAWHRELCDLVASDDLGERCLVVTHRQLRESFAETLERIAAFLDLAPSEELDRLVTEQATRQRTRSSGHRYSLEEFGLDDAAIAAEFGFVRDAFDV